MFSVLYTFFGGLYSVAYTDIVQLCCIGIGLFLTLPFALTHKHVARIAETEDKWLGELKTEDVGSWVDYAFLLVTFLDKT